MLREFIQHKIKTARNRAGYGQRCGNRYPFGRRTWFELLEDRRLLSVTILSEGFEGSFPADNGWSVYDANLTGTPAYWDDVNSTFGGEGTHSGAWKGYCAGFGYAGTQASPTYQNSMNSVMWKYIDLTNCTSATLSFWHKIPSIDAGYDFARVYIGTNLVYERSSALSAWTQQTINLAPYLGGSHTLYFQFTSGSTVTSEGWYLDDIQVTAETLPDLVDYGEAYNYFNPDSVTSPGTPDAGQPWEAHFPIRNNGTTAAGNFYVSFYVSTNSTISIEDYYLSSAYVSGVAGGGWAAATLSLTSFPGGIPAGDYYVGVIIDSTGLVTESNEQNNTAVDLGDYPLTVYPSDPNDQISEAITWPVESTGSGAISASGTLPDPVLDAGDVDMYAITVSAGQRVGIDIDRPSGSLDSFLRLFNSGGMELAWNDNGVGPAPEYIGLESYLEYTFTTAGTYYLGVSGWGNFDYLATSGLGDAAGGTGPYTLTISSGDFNRDLLVGAADYVAWRKGGGSQVAYNLWWANFGLALPTASPGSGTDIVAEPLQDAPAMDVAPAPSVLATTVAMAASLESSAAIGRIGDRIAATSPVFRVSSSPLEPATDELFVPLAPTRRAVGLRPQHYIDNTMEHHLAVSRDDGLMAWLATRADGRIPEAIEASPFANDEPVNGGTDERFDALDLALETLITLGDDWYARLASK